MIKITTVNDMVFQGEEELGDRFGTWLIINDTTGRKIFINKKHIVCTEVLK